MRNSTNSLQAKSEQRFSAKYRPTDGPSHPHGTCLAARPLRLPRNGRRTAHSVPLVRLFAHDSFWTCISAGPSYGEKAAGVAFIARSFVDADPCVYSLIDPCRSRHDHLARIETRPTCRAFAKGSLFCLSTLRHRRLGAEAPSRSAHHVIAVGGCRPREWRGYAALDVGSCPGSGHEAAFRRDAAATGRKHVSVWSFQFGSQWFARGRAFRHGVAAGTADRESRQLVHRPASHASGVA